jgi:hypothetical protein
MKKIIIGLIALLSFVEAFSQGGNDPSKYVWYRYTYGNRLARYQADTVLQIPQDTIWSKDGLAMKIGVLYVGNGTKWTAVGSGGGTDSTIGALTNTGIFRVSVGTTVYLGIDTFKIATKANVLQVRDSILLVQVADWNQATTTAPSYIKNKPTLGTAASKNVPISGNAGAGEVVLGDDSRLVATGTDTAIVVHNGLTITRASHKVDIGADTLAKKLLPIERVLYNANAWVSGDLGTTFTYTGTIGTDVSIVGGKIQMINGNQTIGATTNAAFNRVLKLASLRRYAIAKCENL